MQGLISFEQVDVGNAVQIRQIDLTMTAVECAGIDGYPLLFGYPYLTVRVDGQVNIHRLDPVFERSLVLGRLPGLGLSRDQPGGKRHPYLEAGSIEDRLS